jgi:hypothetical protein
MQPSDEGLDATPKLAPAASQELLDGDLCLGQKARGKNHRLVEHERPDSAETRQQSARLLIQHPMGVRDSVHGGQTP